MSYQRLAAGSITRNLTILTLKEWHPVRSSESRPAGRSGCDSHPAPNTHSIAPIGAQAMGARRNSHKAEQLASDLGLHLDSKAKGTYLLLAKLDRSRQLCVGKLGIYPFPSGWYAYAGSAMGSGGLSARLARHLRAEKRMHWHIDYLLAAAELRASWHIVATARLECAWAGALMGLVNAQIIVRRFGASDCRCHAHLIYLGDGPRYQEISEVLASASRDQGIADALRLLTCTRY